MTNNSNFKQDFSRGAKAYENYQVKKTAKQNAAIAKTEHEKYMISMGIVTQEEIKASKVRRIWSGLAIFVSLIILPFASSPLNLPGVVFGIAAFALAILARKSTAKPLRTKLSIVSIVFSLIAMLVVVVQFAGYIALNAFTGIYF